MRSLFLISVLLLCYSFAVEYHPCIRDCSDTEPMTCYFNWTLEQYRTMSKACYDCPFNITDCFREDCIAADGTEKPVYAVNRQIPGPTIQICLNDTIIVDAHNTIMGAVSILHWHGIRQTETPYMDGAPMITQCPINMGEVFRYTFTPEDPGTFWWHSHIYCQRDGIFGSLVVRSPTEKELFGDLYDYDEPEHVILLQEWNNETCPEIVNKVEHSLTTPPATTVLINGRGRKLPFILDDEIFYPPLARFVVNQGFRYRFRVIANANLNCPFILSVSNHTLTMIASDGKGFEPVEVSSFVITSGERYDFVLEANQTDGDGLFWIKVQVTGFCAVVDSENAFQLAVLQYNGSSDTDFPTENVTIATATEEGIQLNSVNVNPSNTSTIAITELTALEEDNGALKEIPDIQMYVVDDFYALNNPHFHVEGLYGYYQVESDKRQLTPQMDHISLRLPSSPLLSQRYEISPSEWCNGTSRVNDNCTNRYCECVHVEQIPLNAVVEMIYVDQGSLGVGVNHPFHLHGFYFQVVAMERVNKTNLTIADVKELDAAGNITRKLSKAPFKDTISIMGNGYTVIRFLANNPGFWLFHCHIELHFEEGMGFIFKVGENDDMKPIPPGFPSCVDYQPTPTVDDGITNTDSVTTTSTTSSTETTTAATTTTTEEEDYDEDDIFSIVDKLINGLLDIFRKDSD